jgi:cytochrome c oxidase subunit 3
MAVLNFRGANTQRDRTAHLGMWMFLLSWALMFAALFFVYGGLRLREPIWPPMDAPALPLLVPAVNTIVAIASSLVLEWGLRRPRRLNLGLAGGLVLGALFLSLQIHFWTDARALGLLPSTGAYGAALFGLTWVHAAHLLVGVVALAVLAVRGYRGHFTPARMLLPRLWGMYWHFVTFIWCFLFGIVFIL